MAVVMYVPILKARMGEFLALGKANPPVTGAIRPLLEVMQGASGSLYDSVLDFGDRLMATAPKGMIFAVDCRYLRPARSEIDDGPLSLVASDTHDRGICDCSVGPAATNPPAEVMAAPEKSSDSGDYSTGNDELYVVQTDSFGNAGTCGDEYAGTPLQAISPELTAVAPSLPVQGATAPAVSSPIAATATSISTQTDC